MALLPHVRQGHSIISTPPDAAPPMGKRKPSLNPPSHAINRNQPKANPGEPIDLVSQGQETDYDVDSDFERELQISYGEAHAQGKKKRTQVLQNAVQEKTVSVHVHATPVSIQSRSDPRNSDDMTVRQFGEETQMVAESSIQEQQAEEVTSSWRREVGDDADYHHFADTPHKLDNEGAEDEEDWEEASSSDENGFSHVTASLETALFECSDINPQTRIETQPGRGEKRAYSRNSYVPPQGSGFEGSERFIRPGDRETHAVSRFTVLGTPASPGTKS